MQGLGDEVFAHGRAVGISGVDEVDAGRDGCLEDCDGAGVVRRGTPDAVAGDLHGAVAEPVDGEVAAEVEGVGEGGGMGG